MFGKTFGRCTLSSSTGDYEKGIDLPASKKFKSLQQEEFLDQKTVDLELAANIVGVNKHADTYKRPLDPSTMNKFWGTEDRDDVVNNIHYEKNKTAFYECDSKRQATQRAKCPQSKDAAMKEFFGVPETKQPEPIVPIPGYSGVSRRVTADNVFGMTYAEARRCADDSMKKINEEKGDTLKENSKFVAEYNRPSAEDEFW